MRYPAPEKLEIIRLVEQSEAAGAPDPGTFGAFQGHRPSTSGTIAIRKQGFDGLAMQIARRRGMKKAIVALAQRLAVIMHRISVDGTEIRWIREVAAA